IHGSSSTTASASPSATIGTNELLGGSDERRGRLACTPRVVRVERQINVPFSRPPAIGRGAPSLYKAPGTDQRHNPQPPSNTARSAASTAPLPSRSPAPAPPQFPRRSARSAPSTTPSSLRSAGHATGSARKPCVAPLIVP